MNTMEGRRCPVVARCPDCADSPSVRVGTVSGPASLLRLVRTLSWSIAWTALALFASPARAVAVANTDLQVNRAVSLLDCLDFSSGLFDIEGTWILNGVQIPQGGVAAAPELVFQAGSVLLFNPPDLAQSIRQGPNRAHCIDNVYVLATTIRAPADGDATITWDRGEVSAQHFGRGTAPAGSSGISPGADGQSGTPGAPGNAGFSGAHAPNLVLLMGELEGALKVDFRGQDGGAGGEGQEGGHGGAGANGFDARSSLFNCKRPPQRGGDGGDGGVGGRGGFGGHGGVGGTVIVITTEAASAEVLQHLEVDVAGGRGGSGGQPGAGGQPGRGGLGGNGAGLCGGSGVPGEGGKQGAGGSPGPDGSAGEEGDFYLIALPQDQFDKVKGLAASPPVRR